MEVQANIGDRAAIQHLALFVPWEDFMPKLDGNPNEVWRDLEQGLSERIRFYVKNIQLLAQSAEDARRDAKQWAQHCETNYTSEEGGDHLDQEEDVAVGDTDLDVPRAARLAAASLTSSLVNHSLADSVPRSSKKKLPTTLSSRRQWVGSMFSYRRNTPTIRRDDSSSHWLKRWATPLGTRNASTTSCERV